LKHLLNLANQNHFDEQEEKEEKQKQFGEVSQANFTPFLVGPDLQTFIPLKKRCLQAGLICRFRLAIRKQSIQINREQGMINTGEVQIMEVKGTDEKVFFFSQAFAPWMT